MEKASGGPVTDLNVAWAGRNPRLDPRRRREERIGKWSARGARGIGRNLFAGTVGDAARRRRNHRRERQYRQGQGARRWSNRQRAERDEQDPLNRVQ